MLTTVTSSFADISDDDCIFSMIFSRWFSKQLAKADSFSSYTFPSSSGNFEYNSVTMIGLAFTKNFLSFTSLHSTLL